MKWYKKKEKPEGLPWHVEDWDSKQLYKTRTGTLKVKGRNREKGSRCDCRTGGRETVEHFLLGWNLRLSSSH